MNIDKNLQKVLRLLLRKWKVLLLFAIIGCALAYMYTANFTTLTYVSTVQFLTYAVDTDEELSESKSSDSSSSTYYYRTSNTSKMNYAMNMMPTYIALFQTNKFNQNVADDLNASLNTNYTGSVIKNATVIEQISSTSFIKMTVTTTDPDLSYQIAHQLEDTVVEVMKNTNNGLVEATVEDPAVKATTSQSPGYPVKMVIGFAAGAILAAAYVILRDLLDIRIKSSDELSERYGIPVLGAIPEFEYNKTRQTQRKSSQYAQKPVKSVNREGGKNVK